MVPLDLLDPLAHQEQEEPVEPLELLADLAHKEPLVLLELVFLVLLEAEVYLDKMVPVDLLVHLDPEVLRVLLEVLAYEDLLVPKAQLE